MAVRLCAFFALLSLLLSTGHALPTPPLPEISAEHVRLEAGSSAKLQRTVAGTFDYHPSSAAAETHLSATTESKPKVPSDPNWFYKAQNAAAAERASLGHFNEVPIPKLTEAEEAKLAAELKQPSKDSEAIRKHRFYAEAWKERYSSSSSTIKANLDKDAAGHHDEAWSSMFQNRQKAIDANSWAKQHQQEVARLKHIEQNGDFGSHIIVNWKKYPIEDTPYRRFGSYWGR